MTQMRNNFVEKDSNSSNNWLSKIQPVDNLMRMGDGTAMEAEAFSESIPMMSYTPEELGINMDATPQATAIAATNPYPYTDRQEVTVQASNSPALTVVKQDLLDGGVEFSAEKNTMISQIRGEIKDLIMENPLITYGLGILTVIVYQKFIQPSLPSK
jgi:hypothetical protein|tara:strand:+ start:571 stop:1041 length:471 start_codon:yes stop_codon:yes gene_type:complete